VYLTSRPALRGFSSRYGAQRGRDWLFHLLVHHWSAPNHLIATTLPALPGTPAFDQLQPSDLPDVLATDWLATRDETETTVEREIIENLQDLNSAIQAKIRA
jgi:hypothetical protein